MYYVHIKVKSTRTFKLFNQNTFIKNIYFLEIYNEIYSKV